MPARQNTRIKAEGCETPAPLKGVDQSLETGEVSGCGEPCVENCIGVDYNGVYIPCKLTECWFAVHKNQ